MAECNSGKGQANKNMSFNEWYEQFQYWVKLWKELSSNCAWLDCHKHELAQLGLDSSSLSTDLNESIEQILHKILNG